VKLPNGYSPYNITEKHVDAYVFHYFYSLPTCLLHMVYLLNQAYNIARLPTENFVKAKTPRKGRQVIN